jgi:hypothetical protein
MLLDVLHGTASNTISAIGAANNFHWRRRSNRMYKAKITGTSFTSAFVL